jgi:hypothetical protein
MDRANRANVFISTLDARGVYTPDLGGGDISDPNPGSPVAAGPRDRYRVTGQTAQTEVLLEIADATGGIAFRNSNDFDTGFRTLGGVPETSYMLGFTPQNLKYDGKFHILKIAVAGKQKYQIQARRGFYAPKKNVTPAEAAEQEIEEAVYSQEELRSLPITIHTQFYKPAEATAKLAVLAHMDIARMQFDKAEGRNNNNLTIVTALFDRNGNYIIGNEKIVEMKLRDETLEKLNRTGVTVKSTFDVKPGGYMVRLVVRDSNSSAISSENGTVEIPY